jgi:hypothetical protein
MPPSAPSSFRKNENLEVITGGEHRLFFEKRFTSISFLDRAPSMHPNAHGSVLILKMRPAGYMYD